MENKMKKIIALFAVSTLASTSAIAGVALSGTATVSYDDNGSLASATTHDADLTVTGSAGSTTLTATYDMHGTSLATEAVDLSTTIGPLTVTADMFDVEETNNNDGDGDYLSDLVEPTDTGVSVALDAPIGDVTIAIDDSGDLTASGTFAGVSVAVTMGDATKTVVGASIAGMDIDVTNDDGATTWAVATTVGGVDITLDSDNDISATIGLTGNELTVTQTASVAYKAATATKFDTAAADSFTTVAVSRDLTSGATLSATYSSADDSLTLSAAVAF
tara:strand:+ start:508 stop:1335 length:828 start_codon:yes stop_codon:yes gene_type:complete